MIDYEYIIEGDTKEFKNCLIFTCGETKEDAEEILTRLLYNPSDNDKQIIEGHTNLRIEKITKEKCWWNENCD